MGYTIDDKCRENIDKYIREQEEVIRKLEEIRAEWSPSDKRSFRQLLKDNGLGVEAVAGGGMSASAQAKAKCYQEIVAEIESNHIVNVGQLAQLILIGGSGYWNPINWFRRKGYARSQWMLTRLAIEIGRAKWKLGKLKKCREKCKAQ